jgi:hypothetical protein
MNVYVNALDKPLTECLRAYDGFGRLDVSTGVQSARAAPEEAAGALENVLRCGEG